MESKSPKVAIIGNMNNVGFVLMRLLRDRGIDANLILYSNDGTGGNSHFSPENDTADFESWLPFIRRSRVPDNLVTTVSWPLAAYYWLLILAAHLLGRSSMPPRLFSKRKFQNELEGFDFVIGSGPLPALMTRSGRQLDVFWSYSTGVEYLAGAPFREVSRWYSKVFYWFTAPVRRNQERGIRAAQNAVVGLDNGAYEELMTRGISSKRVFVPMVYGHAPEFPSESCRAEAELMAKLREQSDLVCFSAVRQYWSVKRNDIFLRGFSDFLMRNNNKIACLVFMDYGPDVQKSKDLVESLGLSNQVYWLSKKGRMDVRFLSTLADINVGQFDNGPTSWGCVGWEALADGKPLLTGFNWTDGEFESRSGIPAPPILGVTNEADISERLNWALKNRSELIRLGARGQNWFEEWQLGQAVNEWCRMITDKRYE